MSEPCNVKCFYCEGKGKLSRWQAGKGIRYERCRNCRKGFTTQSEYDRAYRLRWGGDLPEGAEPPSKEGTP